MLLLFLKKNNWFILASDSIQIYIILTINIIFQKKYNYFLVIIFYYYKKINQMIRTIAASKRRSKKDFANRETNRLCGCRNKNGNLERGSCGKRGVKEVEEGRSLKPEVISVNRHVLPPRSNVSVLYSPVSDKIFIPRWEKFICLQQHLAPPPAMAIPLFLLSFQRGSPRGWKFIRASLAFVTDRSSYTYVRKSTRGPIELAIDSLTNELVFFTLICVLHIRFYITLCTMKGTDFSQLFFQNVWIECDW